MTFYESLNSLINKLANRDCNYRKKKAGQWTKLNVQVASRVNKKSDRLHVIRISTWVERRTYIDCPRDRKMLCGLRQLYCRWNRLRRKWRIPPSSDNACEKKKLR